MNQKAYMVIGVPGSGKTWVTNQVKDNFCFVHHDAYIGMQGDTYVKEIIKASKTAHKPLLIEAPFSINKIKEPLEKAGIKVEPVFILEHELTLRSRYMQREGKPIPQQHITRLETYRKRAKEMNAFSGTSNQVLEYLKRKR